MTRLAFILVVVVIAFSIFGIVNAIVTPSSRMRALPKAAWIIITLIPLIGGILWFVLGKDRGGPMSQARTMRAPDDDPEFLRSLGEDKAREKRIRDIEARLSELDDDHDDPATK